MNLSVNIGRLKLRNPIMNASGTFGTDDYKEYIDFSKIGALVTKSVTRFKREGNRTPRICEVEGGILNCVGIQNDGVMKFKEETLKKLSHVDTNIIVSISGSSAADYKDLAKILDAEDKISAYEINISCPNISEDGKAFGMFPDKTYDIVNEIKKVSKKTIIVKLTPNVSDITQIAKAAVSAGADALTVANTYIGMAVDIDTKRPVLGNIIGGLSGAAIKPLTLRLVYDVKKSVNVPVIASGGVYTARDALEYIMVGASAVEVGTANFSKPDVMIDIITGIKKFMEENNIDDINDFIGSMND